MKSKLTVEEFTTPNPIAVQNTDRLPLVWETMQNQGIRHVVVNDENGQIVGVISQRDLVTFSQAVDFSKIEAQEIMSKDILTTSPGTPLYEVALRMSEDKIGSVIVCEPDQKELGIFTATDALNALVEVLRGDLNP